MANPVPAQRDPLVSRRDVNVLRAVAARNFPALETLVKQRADLNAATADGETALHWAAYLDDIKSLDLLLANGARPNVANALKVTPIALAAMNGSAAGITRLLKAGADPNVASSVGETPLMWAARAGSVEAVNALIGAGAAVAAREPQYGQDALMWAAAEGHADVIRALLDAHVDVNERSRSGFTPLMFVARSGDVASARILLAAGAQIDAIAPDFLADTAELPWRLDAGEYDLLHASASPPLLIAIMSQNYDVAALLIETGANLNSSDAGYTPLHAAVLHGRIDLVKALLAHGTDIDPVITRTPRRRILGTDLAFAPPFVGTTPLFLAAKFAESEIVRVLADAGADPFFATKGGGGGAAFLQSATAETTLLMAAAGDSWGDAQDRRGRNLIGLSYQDDGRSLETVKTVCALVAARGADLTQYINARNANGETALHAAAARGLHDVVRFLAEHGADVNAKDKRQRTPLTLASSTEGFEKTVELLRSLGAHE